MHNGRIAFPGGSSYRLLVLPRTECMTPGLLKRIETLVAEGAQVVGSPPLRSPSLSGYPGCDARVAEGAEALWGGFETPERISVKHHGNGKIYWGVPLEPEVESPRSSPVTESRWIGYPEGRPEVEAPVETRYYKRTFVIEKGRDLESAEVSITADNAFTLWVNGREAAKGDDFNVLVNRPITRFLESGENILAVAVDNLGTAPNPAGLIAAVELRYEGGGTKVIRTDASWRAGRVIDEEWMRTPKIPETWKPAKDLGEFSMAPWGLRMEEDPCPELYPDYAAVASLLRELGVPEDFSSEGPIRHTHRSTHEREIYFVSNRTAAPVRTECRFRIAEGAPELWHPVTGELRPLPLFTREKGQTVIPLRFEAFESYFVVFRKGGFEGSVSITEGANFSGLRETLELEGAWEVSFDPEWGGPERIVFDRLQDWTTSEKRGIRYYSGIAAYRKRFAWTPPAGSATRLFIDLGTVHDLARVRLNGIDVGTAWCAPWRVEVSAALKSGENILEIEVANRWPNRLAGDREEPDAGVRTVKWDSGLLGGKEYRTGRYTYTTNARSDGPLPSGLLGPVRILTECDR